MTEPDWKEYGWQPTTCPYCEGDELSKEVDDPDEAFMTFNVQCYNCEKEWREEYKLQLIMVENDGKEEFIDVNHS